MGLDLDRPQGVIIPQTRQSAPIVQAIRKVERDGKWHRVGDRWGGTSAEQIARRLNMSQDVLAISVLWIFGYRELGDFSEVWAKWVGTPVSK